MSGLVEEVWHGGWLAVELGLLVTGWVMALTAAGQTPVSGRVVAISDADGVVITTPAGLQSLRLYGIVVPTPGEPYYGEARRVLAGLVFNREVRALPLERRRTDTLAQVLMGGQDVSALMLRAGAARMVKGPWLDEELRSTYAREENAARLAREGLWGRLSGVRP